MSKVSIIRPFTIDIDEVKVGMQTLADGLKSEHGMVYEWVSETEISFKHKSGKGNLKVVGDEMHLNLKLTIFYAAMAPIVKKRINDWADEYIQ
ncbi:MAG: polyhydroxyalkanoic acid system family protein [Sinobacterium sp.]|nr:polyhydroxyalkanoic acid system family protein [Sinobacterium sp.]